MMAGTFLVSQPSLLVTNWLAHLLQLYCLLTICPSLLCLRVWKIPKYIECGTVILNGLLTQQMWENSAQVGVAWRIGVMTNMPLTSANSLGPQGSSHSSRSFEELHLHMRIINRLNII